MKQTYVMWVCGSAVVLWLICAICVAVGFTRDFLVTTNLVVITGYVSLPLVIAYIGFRLLAEIKGTGTSRTCKRLMVAFIIVPLLGYLMIPVIVGLIRLKVF
jgi:hypothetical protein